MAEPTNYVITVYKTEAAAITGDTTTAFAVDADGKINTAGQAATYGFWTHEKYFYRIEANEPVKELYIDWDDGEDNDPNGKANYTSIKFDTPSFVGITSHIYTGNSTTSGGYFPKIRAKSVDGFWSKFYQNRAGAFSHTGIDVLAGETSMSVGRNDTYRIESDTDNSTDERIPALYPQIKPPVAVLKSDRKRVYAGIFNRYLGGQNGIPGASETVDLIEVPNPSSAVRTGVKVRVTYITSGNQDVVGWGGRGDINVTDMSTGDTGDNPNTISNVTKILKVELLNLLEDSVAFNGTSPSTTKLFPGEKMQLVYGSVSTDNPETIAEVSLGNPIVELDDPRYTVTYDLTESFARTQEQTISNYYIDDGARKHEAGYNTDRIQVDVGVDAKAAHTDVFSDHSNLHNTDSGVKRSSYAFDHTWDVVDSDFRWLPRQILARGQIKVSNPLGTTAKRNMQYSPLEHWVNENHTLNYSDTMEDIAAYNWTSDIASSGILAFKGTDDKDKWKDKMPDNNVSWNALFQSSGSGDSRFGDACTTLDDADNTAVLICAKDKKWTQQFWDMKWEGAQTRGRADYVIPGSDNDPLSASTGGVGTAGVGHQNIRVQAFYTAYEHNSSARFAWKPLKYLNKTKHPEYDDSTWYADGTFQWEDPDDWVSVDPDAIDDNYYPTGEYYNASDATTFAFSTHNQPPDTVDPNSSTAADVDYFSGMWDENNKKYGLMFLIKADSSNTGRTNTYRDTKIVNTWPCSNSHSVIVDMIDPMHVSLNSFDQVQSISYSHKGKYQTVENRLGKSDIRKIGSSSGNISFGGIDIADGKDARKKYERLQSNAVPVYLDVDNENGDITRFFGLITSMSRDHPTGKVKPKFGINMTVTHMITMNSSGTMLSDGYASLGGKIDEPKYI